MRADWFCGMKEQRDAGTGKGSVAATFLVFCLALSAVVAPAGAQDGLIVKTSPYTVAKTLDRLAKLAKDKGLTIFSRLNHAEGAREAGLNLRSTELLIIGNPKVGTPLMQADQRIALDLPLRVAAWLDEDGTVRIGYWSPEVFATRYGIDSQTKRLENIKAALDGLTDAAIAVE